jgi:hypothetical protein
MKKDLLLLPLLFMTQVLFSEEMDTLSFQFNCLGMDESFRRMELFYDTADGRAAIRMNDLAKTQLYSYSGDGILKFYKNKEGGSAIATYNYDQDFAQPLLIFVKSSDDKYQIFSMDNSWDKLPINSYLFYNLSSKKLAWRVGEDYFGVEPGKSKMIKSEFKGEKTPIFALKIGEDDSSQRVYRAMWLNYDNIRRIIFIRDTLENEAGAIRVKVIEDFYHE